MTESKQKSNFHSKEPQVISLEKGKIPPQAIDLEEAILGATLQDKFAVGQVVEIFRKEQVFYKIAHQEIYNAMLEMFEESEPVDLLSISHKLKSRKTLEKIGGEYFLIQLTQKFASSAHIEHHCRIVMQMHVKRQSIKVANEIISQSYNEEKDIFELLSDSQKQIDDVAQWLIRKKPSDFKTVVDSIFDASENKVPGIPSSLAKLQKKLNGYRETDLIILAARPGMGKTALLINEAKNMAKLGIPVGIFSLEMSAKDLGRRMLAEECGIDSSKLTLNRVNEFERRSMNEKRSEFEKLPIYIHDQAGLSPMELKVQAGKWKREHNVKMFFVDYLQLMNASGKNGTGNREQEISSISRSLKAVAKDLECPVMALSQLSRAVEQRGGFKRPILSDLRESGAIEQDADIIMFLLRPEYYKIDTWDDEDHTYCRGQAEITIAKFRGGETGQTIVGCDLKYMRFYDLEERDTFFDNLPVSPNQNVKDAFDDPDKKELLDKREIVNNPDDENDGLPF
jgi:replicative DNA helicase